MFANSLIKSTARNATIHSVLKMNFLLNQYQEAVWLLGDARSGTTWVSNLINYDKRYREMFEPYHPTEVAGMSFLKHNQYYRVNELDEDMLNISHDIFRGKFQHHRVDANNRQLRYRGLLVKDIYANLLSYAVCRELHHIKPVLLIRNPFSVALSKFNKRGGKWPDDPTLLLKQKALFDDYLYEFEGIIHKVAGYNNYILKQMLIWCILNYVPLRQYPSGDLYICFYEDFYRNPREELVKLKRYLSHDTSNVLNDLSVSDSVISKPSFFTNENSPIVLGKSPLLSWQNEIPAKVIDQGYGILSAFNFSQLYDEQCVPNKTFLP